MGILHQLKQFAFVKLRILKYKALSTCKQVSGQPKLYHPLLLNGKGKISFGKNVQIGVVNSPNYYSHYSYFEARCSESEIIIGNNVSINNNCSIEALIKITIKDDVLIGINCAILDNDGHHLDTDKRNLGTPNSKAIIIEKNGCISGVYILPTNNTDKGLEGHVKEALFASAPWIPALQDGKRLRYKTYFSVQFP